MAMNKQDYRNDGRDVARALIVAGAMQGYENGYPVNDLDGKPLNVSMNGSWQATAWKQGFDEMRAEWSDTLQMKTLRSQAQTHHFKAEYGVKQSPRETAKKHVSAILAQAYIESDDNRRSRILRKVVKLRAKWDL